MTKAVRNWRIVILLVVLIGVAGVLIASAPTASSTCPSNTNCPQQAEVKKECTVKGVSDKGACKLLSDDGSKKVCSYKGQCGKKADCDHPKQKCGL